MRINPIQNVYSRPYNIAASNQSTKAAETESALASTPDNYGRALVFQKNNLIRNKVLKAPFEDKLAVGLQELTKSSGLGNFLLVANNKEKFAGLMKFIDIPVPIKKLVLLTDSSLKDSLLFTFNGKNITLINTNHENIVTSELELLNTGDSTKIADGMHFRISQGLFEIKKSPDTDIDLEKYSSMFMQVVDYTKELEKSISTHNKKVKTQIETLDKPTSKAAQLTFDSVGGQDEVIESLRKNILYPLKYPDVFDGFMMSRGAILYGKPGTGKTLLAQALAAESGASFFELCATDLANKYVGESEKNCRELFAKAVDAQPSIIYFDEIDALGKARGKDQYGDKLLAQFLSLMSDLEKRGDRVFVVGSTNRREDLDSAFTRSGRFSTLLEVKAPDLKGTRQILSIHTKEKPIDNDVDMEDIANKMHARNMTGADIALTVKEAFSHALERTGIYESMKRDAYSPLMKEYLTINAEDFIYAIDNFKNNSNKWATVGFKK